MAAQSFSRWWQVLNWDVAAERATAPEDANRAGPLWVTEFDMVPTQPASCELSSRRRSALSTCRSRNGLC